MTTDFEYLGNMQPRQ